MDDKELGALFMGYGYQVRIVGHDLDRIDEDMAASLQWALSVIRSIQKAAREDKPIFKPRWPVIILRSPKVRLSSVCRMLLFTHVLSLGLGCTCEIQGRIYRGVIPLSPGSPSRCWDRSRGAKSSLHLALVVPAQRAFHREWKAT